MDESKALNKLLECADLIAMLEDLSSAASRGMLSASGIAGTRITLRGIREQLLGTHDILAKAIMARVKTNETIAPQASAMQTLRESMNTPQQRVNDFAPGARPANAIGQDGNGLTRRDLRAMIEKGMEG